jgi:hypothetical protein
MLGIRKEWRTHENWRREGNDGGAGPSSAPKDGKSARIYIKLIVFSFNL